MQTTTNEEVWEVKAKQTWIDSFLSCHHQLPEKCNCPERRRELRMYIDKLLSTQEEKIRKEEREKYEDENYWANKEIEKPE